MVISPEDLRKQWNGTDDKPAEDLPPLTTLEVDVEGSRGKRYRGSFTFKVPTVGDQIEIGRLKAAYLPNGAASDPNAALLVEQCCFLEVTLQKKTLPSWWKPFEMYDALPISAVYAEAIKYERRFHRAGQNLTADSASAAGTENIGGNDSEGGVGLGQDISPTPKRSKILIAESSRSD